MSMFALARSAVRSRVAAPAAYVRSFGGYPQPSPQHGSGASEDTIASDEQMATGRERLELEALNRGEQYFNREPVQMMPGQGSFENPVLVPSHLHDRVVGIVPKGQDQPLWFELTDKYIHYVSEVGVHFKLDHQPLNE